MVEKILESPIPTEVEDILNEASILAVVEEPAEKIIERFYIQRCEKGL